ncbi:DUF397 domain-containing protein [Nocardia sp. BMG51109]|uniref:DUF397 domain-containing protein n=1 Tax=Nocardia sp. BMG51109 TaxID=1056816 RepID=UPI000465C37B|nr:DUF397 domain-containing protein [Nocardia sp. BMG51109]
MNIVGVAGRGGWFKSSFSKDSNSCVEVRLTDSLVYVRDSKYRGLPEDQPIITVASAAWPTVLDLALAKSSGTVNDDLTIALHPAGSATLTDGRGVQLVYNADEWDAFTKGVADGQFDRR